MGTISHDEKRRTIFGENLTFSFWITTDEMSSGEGGIHIDITETDQKCISFDFPEEATEKWLNRFIECWCYNKAFRKQFQGEYIEVKSELFNLPPDTAEQRKEKESKLQQQIKKLNKKSGKFKDFMQLKSGRDRFSSLKREDLIELVPNELWEYEEVLALETSEQLKVMRWFCRGLSKENSIRKIKTDLEISSNIKR